MSGTPMEVEIWGKENHQNNTLWITGEELESG